MAETRLKSQQAFNGDGWQPAGETWTYASASTITVPSGAASKYQVGDRIKWTQTTVKYGVIAAVADTLLTIIVNTDYTVANATISANYYSHEANPMGYPTWFNWTPTVAGNGSQTATYSATYSTCRYSVVGRAVTILYKIDVTLSGTPSDRWTATLPIAPVNTTGGFPAISLQNGAGTYASGWCATDYSNNKLIFFKDGLATWANASAPEVYAEGGGTYQI